MSYETRRLLARLFLTPKMMIQGKKTPSFGTYLIQDQYVSLVRPEDPLVKIFRVCHLQIKSAPFLTNCHF